MKYWEVILNSYPNLGVVSEFSDIVNTVERFKVCKICLTTLQVYKSTPYDYYVINFIRTKQIPSNPCQNYNLKLIQPAKKIWLGVSTQLEIQKLTILIQSANLSSSKVIGYKRLIFILAKKLQHLKQQSKDWKTGQEKEERP